MIQITETYQDRCFTFQKETVCCAIWRGLLFITRVGVVDQCLIFVPDEEIYAARGNSLGAVRDLFHVESGYKSVITCRGKGKLCVLDHRVAIDEKLGINRLLTRLNKLIKRDLV